MPQQIDVPGHGIVEFPDGMSDAQIVAAIKSNPAPTVADKAGGLYKAFDSGVAKGVAGIGGFIGDASNLGAQGIEAATNFVTDKLGMERNQTGDRSKSILNAIPTSESVGKSIQKEFYGGAEPYKPQNTSEKYLHTIGEFGVGMVGGGAGRLNALGRAFTNVVAPAVGSEAAGQATEGTKWEPWARFGGSIAGPAAAQGFSKAATGLGNYLDTRSTAKQISDVLGQPVNTGAVRRMASSAAEDGLTPQAVAAKLSELGPQDAMVLDMGRQLGGRAEAIASQPGRGQNLVLDAVENRTGQFGSGTASRVQQSLDKEFGASHNLVDLREGIAAIVDKHAKPLYEKVMGEHPVVNVPSSIAERPAVARAMGDAVGLAKNYGEKLQETTRKTILSGDGYHIAEDVVNPAKTSLRYWDYVKKSLDQRINGYYKSGGVSELSSADKADLGGLLDARKALVGHLDEATNGAYKNARQVAANKPQLTEAVEFGRTAFNSKMLPEEFASELSAMSLPQQTMAKAGFRRELNALIENSRNEGATARRVLDTNSVLQKAEVLFGPKAVAEIERRIAAENTFQNATQKIAQNSRTAVRQELRKDTETPSTAALGSISIPGLVAMGGRGGLNYIREQGMANTREGIGKMLTARGDNADQVMQLLLDNANKRAVSSQSGAKLAPAALASTLLEYNRQRQDKPR